MKQIQSDLTIIGGGMTGVCASLAAARLGTKVTLINDRPLLGGNSSSEFRVWISGAQTGWNRYARESGILEELLMQNHHANPEGNPHIWDSILLDAVSQEPNIQVYLNTYVNHVTTENGKITAVQGFQMRTHEEIEWVSPLYLDSTGDGVVAFLAGASFMLGREGKDTFGESLAPETGDRHTMGNTLFFYTTDAGRPVKFHRPVFSAPPEELGFLEDQFRGPYIDERAHGCDYWWFEYGGVLDTIQDDPLITKKVQSLVWGIWDHIKNSGKFKADTLTLEWIGTLPGKRESRRFMGDYVLTQNDIEQSQRFIDAVGFGGWPIDIHPPEGIYSSEPPCHQIPVGIYDLPYRTLYSKDVGNLFLAGRNHSASRIAFSSTRVMATCAVMGQAVGTAAFLATRNMCQPREVYQHHIKELQQLLLREDAYIIGVKSKDKDDRAKVARVTASSERTIENGTSDQKTVLDADYCLVLPIKEHIDYVELLVGAEEDTSLAIHVYDTERKESYNPSKRLQEHTLDIAKGDVKWHRIPLTLQPPPGGKAALVLKRNSKVFVGSSNRELTGVLSLKESINKKQTPGVLNVPYVLANSTLCFRMEPVQRYSSDYVVSGIARPYGEPQMWSSANMKDKPEMLCFTWDEPQVIKELRIAFNTDLNTRFINLKRSLTNVFPQTVKDYDVKVEIEGELVTMAAVRGNYKRLNVHRFDAVKTDHVQIVIYDTNGSPFAEVYEVRIY